MPWLDGLLTALGATLGALAMQHSDALSWLLAAWRDAGAAARTLDPRWWWLAWGAALAALARLAASTRGE